MHRTTRSVALALIAALALLILSSACGDDAAPSNAAPVADAGADANPDDDAGSDTGSDASADAAPDAPEPGWADRAPLAVAPRQETSVMALNGAIWVLGGFDDTGAIVPTLEAYDPATDTWRRAADLPIPMHHTNAVAAAGKLWVLGGLVGQRFIASGQCFVYDPATDAWTELDPMPPGTERGGGGVGVIGDAVHIVGGLRGAAVADVSAYDVTTGAWTTLPNLPAPRDHAAAGVVGDTLILAGGRDRSIQSHSPSTWTWTPGDAAWTQAADMPTSRGGVATASLDGKLYVFGGEGADNATGVFAEVEAYNLADNRWEALPPMQTPRHGTGAAALGATIYIPGGATVIAFGAVDTHEAYTP